MPDPCVSCGACCQNVRGVTAIWAANGWLLPDNSCKFYERWTKKCMIYEARPDICRMERTCPPGMELEDWYTYMRGHCQDAHQIVFGSPLEEPGETCHHRHPVLEIQVEISAACNAKCRFCPYSKPVNDARRGNLMGADLFHKIADEVATIPQIANFVFNGLGESLLHPQVYDFISYVTKRCPHVRTLLHTNGTHLDPARLHATGLRELVVSLNAVDAYQHEKIMGLKGQFEKVCAKIEEARKLSGWTVTPRAVYSKDDFTEYDAQEFLARWKDVFLAQETNWIAHNRTQQLPANENEGCYRALSQIYVAYNGDFHMCCMDALGRIVFGNVRAQTIREVYNSEKYVAFRQAHADGRATDIKECRGCTRC
jgi:MoaA/NifB/PqqE/SkfB family radical SAM enzyme